MIQKWLYSSTCTIMFNKLYLSTLNSFLWRYEKLESVFWLIIYSLLIAFPKEAKGRI